MSQLAPYLWSSITRYQRDSGAAINIVSLERPTRHGYDTELFRHDAVTVQWAPATVGIDAWDQWIKETGTDVALIGGWFMEGLRAVVMACRRRGIPVLGLSDTPYVVGRESRLWRGVKSLFVRRYFDALMVPGERAAVQAELLGFPRHEQLRPLYCVDVSLYRYSKAMNGDRNCRFMFAGRWAREKNAEFLLDAYQRYRQRAKRPWDLVLAGPVDVSTREQLNKLDGVRHVGMLQPDDFRLLLRSVEVFVLPSVFDPWPLVVLEACAAGLPIVVSYCCGNSVELLIDRVNGWRISPFDHEGCAATLLEVAEDEAACRRMGSVSQTIATGFDVSRWSAAVAVWTANRG